MGPLNTYLWYSLRIVVNINLNNMEIYIRDKRQRTSAFRMYYVRKYPTRWRYRSTKREDCMTANFMHQRGIGARLKAV